MAQSVGGLSPGVLYIHLISKLIRVVLPFCNTLLDLLLPCESCNHGRSILFVARKICVNILLIKRSIRGRSVGGDKPRSTLLLLIPNKN